MPKMGASLSPDGVEFVAAALARCRELMQRDDQFRDQAEAHDAALTRFLMRDALSGDRDVEALAGKAIELLRSSLRVQSMRS